MNYSWIQISALYNLTFTTKPSFRNAILHSQKPNWNVCYYIPVFENVPALLSSLNSIHTHRHMHTELLMVSVVLRVQRMPETEEQPEWICVSAAPFALISYSLLLVNGLSRGCRSILCLSVFRIFPLPLTAVLHLAILLAAGLNHTCAAIPAQPHGPTFPGENPAPNTPSGPPSPAPRTLWWGGQCLSRVTQCCGKNWFEYHLSWVSL